MGFTVKLILVLAVVAGGVWAWMTFHPTTQQPAQQQVAVQPPAPPPAPPAPPTAADTITASGNSDAALQGDLNTLDTQVQSAQDANASADSSFNDQPVSQTE